MHPERRIPLFPAEVYERRYFLRVHKLPYRMGSGAKSDFWTLTAVSDLYYGVPVGGDVAAGSVQGAQGQAGRVNY